MSRYSVVIPAYNEERLLPRLLTSIETARHAYENGDSAIEVIVADDGSTDRTSQLATEFGCRVITTQKRCIGAVRNAGAAAAQGEILAFIDADSAIHPDTFAALDAVLSDPRVIGGATGVRFERESLGINTLRSVLFVAAATLGVPRTYNGVIFCRRADFALLGGYDETKLFGEDIDFLLKLRRLGRRRKQHLNRQFVAPALFSTRKFDQHGDWHYLSFPLRAVWGAFTRRNEWARRYWYDAR